MMRRLGGNMKIVKKKRKVKDHLKVRSVDGFGGGCPSNNHKPSC